MWRREKKNRALVCRGAEVCFIFYTEECRWKKKLLKGRRENKMPCYGKSFILLEELIVLLVQTDSILTPELFRLVHRAPFQAAGLELRAVLIKWAVDKRKQTNKQNRHYTWTWKQRGKQFKDHHCASLRKKRDATFSRPIYCEERWFEDLSQYLS